MLSPTRPSAEQLRAVAADAASRPLNYPAGLLAREPSEPALWPDPRAGWIVDRARTVVGRGSEGFEAARRALREWRQFDPAWTASMTPPAPIEDGAVVAYAAQVLGVWWSYSCRILEVIDQPDRFGFVYGTIEGHAECGEELFLVELEAGGDVVFSLHAMSRPGRWFAWPGLPIARRAQARFRRAAGAAMRRAVAEACPESVT